MDWLIYSLKNLILFFEIQKACNAMEREYKESCNLSLLLSNAILFYSSIFGSLIVTITETGMCKPL